MAVLQLLADIFEHFQAVNSACLAIEEELKQTSLLKRVPEKLRGNLHGPASFLFRFLLRPRRGRMHAEF